MQLTFIIKKIKVAHKLQASNELKNWETLSIAFLVNCYLGWNFTLPTSKILSSLGRFRRFE